ncbi:MAG: VTT domain-containing protein [Deltaproteobacteria bacterium]|nr:VTT domain-containing protein [Deltaproteobacteria bacterium]
MIKTKTQNILLILFIALIITSWVISSHYLNFDSIKFYTLKLVKESNKQQMLTLVILFAIHAIGMIFSLPTKGIFTIVSGALLGVAAGSFVTITGVITGTTLLFYFIKMISQSRFNQYSNARAEHIKVRIKKHPIASVAALRLVLTLPYGPITIISALSQIKYIHFIAGSILGDLPVVLLYSAAGNRLASLARPQDAVSIETILILSVAGIALLSTVLFSKDKKLSGHDAN